MYRENEYQLPKDASEKEQTAYLLWKSPQEVLFFSFCPGSLRV